MLPEYDLEGKKGVQGREHQGIGVLTFSKTGSFT
jgi:hypothetical protein